MCWIKFLIEWNCHDQNIHHFFYGRDWKGHSHLNQIRKRGKINFFFFLSLFLPIWRHIKIGIRKSSQEISSNISFSSLTHMPTIVYVCGIRKYWFLKMSNLLVAKAKAKDRSFLTLHNRWIASSCFSRRGVRCWSCC